tara:strand:+ start:36553 stop:36780 length:228 start_codon:yes stop_codon:yes gene_type:complete
MEICNHIDAENKATLDLLALIEKDFGGLPARVIAGALMRTSVALAVEVLGPVSGEQAARQALESILSQRKQRKLQ